MDPQKIERPAPANAGHGQVKLQPEGISAGEGRQTQSGIPSFLSTLGPGAPGRCLEAAAKSEQAAAQSMNAALSSEISRRVRWAMKDFKFKPLELQFLYLLILLTFDEDREERYIQDPQKCIADWLEADEKDLARAIKRLQACGVIHRQLMGAGVVYRMNPDPAGWMIPRKGQNAERLRSQSKVLARPNELDLPFKETLESRARIVDSLGLEVAKIGLETVKCQIRAVPPEVGNSHPQKSAGESCEVGNSHLQSRPLPAEPIKSDFCSRSCADEGGKFPPRSTDSTVDVPNSALSSSALGERGKNPPRKFNVKQQRVFDRFVELCGGDEKAFGPKPGYKGFWVNFARHAPEGMDSLLDDLELRCKPDQVAIYGAIADRANWLMTRWAKLGKPGKVQGKWKSS